MNIHAPARRLSKSPDERGGFRFDRTKQFMHTENISDLRGRRRFPCPIGGKRGAVCTFTKCTRFSCYFSIGTLYCMRHEAAIHHLHTEPVDRVQRGRFGSALAVVYSVAL